MEVIFESTEHFEKELAQFQSREQATIISKINLYCGSYPSNPEYYYRHAYRPLQIELMGNFESSLYTLRINKDIRVIHTLEEDPLFDQAIVTLFHVVRHKDLEKTFRGLAVSLYQKQLNRIVDGGEF